MCMDTNISPPPVYSVNNPVDERDVEAEGKAERRHKGRTRRTEDMTLGVQGERKHEEEETGSCEGGRGAEFHIDQ